METIHLFPLSTVLFPQGRMQLQIFEPRYLDLVSHCLKSDGGFGVVWLREGSEVHKINRDVDPRLAQVGTFSRIVDWDSLPNGFLGITIEGTKKFRLVSSYQRDDNLNMAEVEWIAGEAIIDLPEQFIEMEGLLSQLLEHPHLEQLKFNSTVKDVSSLSFLLAQLLPIKESIKFDLLSISDPLIRLEKLMELLDEYD